MEKTPISMRKHIALVGKTNSGKSTLFNQLIGQDISIISEVKGTTTDPVTKTMELLPYGPVAIIDTAGLGDDTRLGREREEKTLKILDRTDLVLYVIDSTEKDKGRIEFKKPTIKVYTKCELLNEEEKKELITKNPDSIFLSNLSKVGIENLKARMVEELKKLEKDDSTLIGNLLPKGSVVLMVVPIDSAAPKGRLILPQVQLLRDCLDNDMKAYVTKETTLKEALSDLVHLDLVVTDSQVFSLVNEIVPREIPLTSFSMLLANQKGNFKQYLDGAKYISRLKDKSRVLVMEGCTHNSTHEDIARVKIPKLIEKKTGAKCSYDYYVGYDFPDNILDYDLVLSCGMCMINKQEVTTRLEKFKAEDIPVVNYGVALAYLNGILDRAKEIFDR